MAVDRTFQPYYGTGQSLTANAGSQAASALGKSKAVCITNTGSTNLAYIRISRFASGGAPTAASAADYPVMPGAQVIVTKDDEDNGLTYISPSGTTLHVMLGEGF